MDKVLVLEIITHGLRKDLAKGVRLVEAAIKHRREDGQETVYLGVVESPYSLNQRIRYISQEKVYDKAKRIVEIEQKIQQIEEASQDYSVDYEKCTDECEALYGELFNITSFQDEALIKEYVPIHDMLESVYDSMCPSTNIN